MKLKEKVILLTFILVSIVLMLLTIIVKEPDILTQKDFENNQKNPKSNNDENIEPLKELTTTILEKTSSESNTTINVNIKAPSTIPSTNASTVTNDSSIAAATNNSTINSFTTISTTTTATDHTKDTDAKDAEDTKDSSRDSL